MDMHVAGHIRFACRDVGARAENENDRVSCAKKKLLFMNINLQKRL